MPYFLNFSDPSNSNTVPVPDYPPGINAVDTSLSFVGKGYPNFGFVMNQNLLKILENFAADTSPSNPIKGQLWYDSFTQSLKLFDGTVWKSSNGIYQQTADPAIASPVSVGDVWVDTTTDSLNIRGSSSWVKIGPTITTSTGINIETLTVGSTSKTVLSVYVNGVVVAIFNNDSAFTPTTIPGNLQGFSKIGKGITLPESSPDAYTLIGTADNATKLDGISGSSYLRKNDNSAGGQIITGKIVYETSDLPGGENRDGVVIRTAGDNPALNYIQFFKKNNDAIISNEVKGGKIILKIKGITDTNQTNAVVVEKNQITVQGNLTVTGGTLSANTVSGTLITAAQPSITSLGTLSGLNVGGAVTVTGSITSGNITSTGTVRTSFLYADSASIQGVYSTGTLQVWAGSTSTGVPTGWLVCSGALVSKAAYPGLWNFLGNRYGTSTPTDFYLPNLAVATPLPAGGTTPTYYLIKQD